ncbi:DUF4012 domain-containing protein, partial [Patescibacteria group bacterium]|nr:DUF4012 domain-containing protein [Patescibacteria group bacterium]
KVDFELPNESTDVIEKIEYSQPNKLKTKSKIKLNLTNSVLELETEQTIPDSDFYSLTLDKQIWKVIKTSLNLIWQIITVPFRALDFIVDSVLKSIWWMIKNAILLFFSLLKSFVLNLKTLILQRQPQITQTQIITLLKLKIPLKVKPILSFIIVCLIIVLPLQILSLQQKGSQLKGQVLGKSIEGLDALKNASQLTQDLNFAEASEYFEQAYFNFKIAHNYLTSLDAFSQQVIKIIPEAQQAEILLTIGQISAELGQNIANIAEEIEKINSNPLEQNKLGAKIKITAEKLTLIEPKILELLNQAEQIDAQILKKYIDEKNLEKLILFQSSLPALRDYISQLKTLNTFLQNFLGQEKTMHYLVIFQNNAELRPTGGFMGSYALVEISNSKITKMEVPGGGFYDLKAAVTDHVKAPKPLQHFSPDWKIWDANWFADFPTSAQKISKFYEDTLAGTTLDGIITLTPDVIEDLLEITGELVLPEYEKTLTAENFTNEVQMAVEYEYDAEENKPKQIIADMMPKLLDRVFNLGIENTPALMQKISENLSHKNILLWFKDIEMQKIAKNFKWSGEILPSSSDYLTIIHASLAGGKTDRVIKNEIAHSVEITSAGDVIDTTTLTRTHTGNPQNIFEKAINVDYVRFYVPYNSQLISANGFEYKPNTIVKAAADNQIELAEDKDLKNIEQNPVVNEDFNLRITQEFDKTVFGGWLSLEPGESKKITLKYKLPFKLIKPTKNFLQKIAIFLNLNKEENFRYNLIVQKQPGLAQTEFISQLILPADFQVIDHSAKNKLGKAGQKIIYQDDLETDGYYSIKMQ